VIHEWSTLKLLPGDLWIHMGPRPVELFPPDLGVAKGSAGAAKQRAVDEQIVMLLEIRANGYALRTAQRNGGYFDILNVPDAKLADLITTGFVTGQGIRMVCHKNRHGSILESFMHYPRTSGLFWTLLENA